MRNRVRVRAQTPTHQKTEERILRGESESADTNTQKDKLEHLEGEGGGTNTNNTIEKKGGISDIGKYQFDFCCHVFL